MTAPRPGTKLLEKLEGAKRASFAQLVFLAARLINERGVARVREKGRVRVRLAHTALLPHIDFDGQRLSDLAERAGLSKQTVGPLVAELAELGMVAVEPDPDDGRAKRVRYTKMGAEALIEGIATLREIEQELAVELGPRHTRALHEALLRLVAILEAK